MAPTATAPSGSPSRLSGIATTAWLGVKGTCRSSHLSGRGTGKTPKDHGTSTRSPEGHPAPAIRSPRDGLLCQSGRMPPATCTFELVTDAAQAQARFAGLVASE